MRKIKKRNRKRKGWGRGEKVLAKKLKFKLDLLIDVLRFSII
jgi:hypothetical protein